MTATSGGPAPRTTPRSALLVALLAVAALLAGCGGTAEADEPTAAASPERPQTRTVEDAYGSVELPADPQRVVVLWSRGLPELADVLDVPLVGATTDGGTLSPLLRPETAEGVTSVGETAEPDLERVAALRPDLVVAFTTTLDAPGVRDKVAAIAPTFAIDGATLFDTPWRDVVRGFARGVDREAEADEVIGRVDARIAELRPRIAERYAGQTVSVLTDFGDGRTGLLTPKHVSGSVLAELGLGRPAGQPAEPATVELSPERITEGDADHLFYFFWGYGGEPAALEDNPLWPRLRAVRTGQAYEVDGQAWTVPVPTAVEVVLDDVERHLLG